MKQVESGDGIVPPPRPLGKHGTKLWRDVQAECDVTYASRIELLMQACAALDRAEALAAAVAEHGPFIAGRINPAVKEELRHRVFVVSTLKKLFN